MASHIPSSLTHIILTFDGIPVEILSAHTTHELDIYAYVLDQIAALKISHTHIGLAIDKLLDIAQQQYQCIPSPQQLADIMKQSQSLIGQSITIINNPKSTPEEAGGFYSTKHLTKLVMRKPSQMMVLKLRS